ncbi:tripartite tricarboxylate transporter TctB family protein [Cryobacterium sp. Y62]|uniref:tripartite tricarboxylate transporter TctB family protein n=1 Tax=Cryobacterium sp. Y62 TaxID=2048284 RepID=UPI000CE35CA7|nr:tripartite tricarboxylate transporter TctB family protein [Cryobacterium sp. Y62]
MNENTERDAKFHPPASTVTDAAASVTVGPAPSPQPAQPPQSWLAGRSELVVAAMTLGIAVFLTVGIVTMDVPEGAGSPGPTFFPIIVTGLLYVLAVLLAVQVVRAPRPVDGDSNASRVGVSSDLLNDVGDIDTTSEIRVIRSTVHPKTAAKIGLTDWKTTSIVLASVIVFVLVLQPVGWLLAAAALFWALAWALGSKRPVFDIGVSLIFSSCMQLAFSAGLGLTLPSGILTGVFSWIS